jgi:hypothetical protein
VSEQQEGTQEGPSEVKDDVINELNTMNLGLAQQQGQDAAQQGVDGDQKAAYNKAQQQPQQQDMGKDKPRGAGEGEQQQEEVKASWGWVSWWPWQQIGASIKANRSTTSSRLNHGQQWSQLYCVPPAASAFVRRPGHSNVKQRQLRPCGRTEGTQDAQLVDTTGFTREEAGGEARAGDGGSSGGDDGATAGPIAEANEWEFNKAQWQRQQQAQQQQGEPYDFGGDGYEDLDEELLEETAREAAEAQRRARIRMAIRQQRTRPDAVYRLEEREAARMQAAQQASAGAARDGGQRGAVRLAREAAQGRGRVIGKVSGMEAGNREGYERQGVMLEEAGGEGMLPGQVQQQQSSDYEDKSVARRVSNAHTRPRLEGQESRQYGSREELLPGYEVTKGVLSDEVTRGGVTKRESNGRRVSGVEGRRRSGGDLLGRELVEERLIAGGNIDDIPYVKGGWDDADGQATALHQLRPSMMPSSVAAVAVGRTQAEEVQRGDGVGGMTGLPSAAEIYQRLLFMSRWGFLVRDVIGAPVPVSPLDEDEIADQVCSAWKLASNCLLAVVSSCSCLMLGAIGPAGIAGVLKPQLWCLLGLWVAWLGYLLVFQPYCSTLVGVAELGCSFGHAACASLALAAVYAKQWVGNATGLGVAVLYGQVVWVVLLETGRLLGLGWRLWIYGSRSRSTSKVQPFIKYGGMS